MVVGLIRGSVKGIRKFLRHLGLSVGMCFDDYEFTSLLRSINTRYDNYWLLGWKEHRISSTKSMFILTLIDENNKEYAIRIYVNVGVISMVIPVNSLNITDDTTGITIMMNENSAHLSGRILCITGVKVKRLS